MIRNVRDSLCSQWLFRRANAMVWFRLPEQVRNTRPVQNYGEFLQRMVRLRGAREQNPRTYFLRNRPELDLINQIASRQPEGGTLKVSVLACSMGAEAYSLAWALEKARPDLKIEMHALDILPEVLEVAKEGYWAADAYQLERLTAKERDEFFESAGDKLRVRKHWRERIKWHLQDATKPEVIDLLGLQDIVIANRFLCHMQPDDAERTLRLIARLVAPGGHLVCSGVDLAVRTKVARELGWQPVQDLMEEIHDGDPSQRNGWPWEYWALEPLNKQHDDWRLRYASVFQIGDAPA